MLFINAFEHDNIFFDAAYKDIRDSQSQGFDYSQIVKDFDIPADQISKKVIVT